jgi:8-oxo-dGTP diphosphatase
VLFCPALPGETTHDFFTEGTMPKSEQGVTFDRFMVIPRTLIFVLRDEHVLLIKGAPTKRLWANLYNGIGGHIEPGEDALSAARRELSEETGLQAGDLRQVGTIIIDAGQPVGILLVVYRGTYAGGDLVASAEGQLEWVPLSRLAQYPLVADLRLLLPRVVGQQPGDPPFAARSFYDEHDQQQLVFND